MVLNLKQTERADSPEKLNLKRGNILQAAAKGLVLLVGVVAIGGVVRAQEMQMPQESHASHAAVSLKPIEPKFPKLGKPQEQASGPLMNLEQVLRIAAESNPTLRQAEAEIRAAKARKAQAGLYPNPTIAYAGDEIRGGAAGGGKQGFFLQQAIVTGGKLGLSKNVFSGDVKLAEIEAEEQKMRVQSAVRISFLSVLAAQEQLEIRAELAGIAQDSAETQKRLMNTGQADESELLDAEVEAQRARLAARTQESRLGEQWRSLAAVMGRPDLPLTTVGGQLDRGWPDLSQEKVMDAMAFDSPAIRIANETESRAKAVVARAARESVPDVVVRAGLEDNHEPVPGSGAKGWEGIAEVSTQIPLFNRNQGNIAAARADLERAVQEKNRVALTLRERAAEVADQYANARFTVMHYRDEILPRASKSYSLLVNKYGQMLASYPRVLDAQHRLYGLESEYIAALETVWTSGISLEGYLLTDGLEAPTRPGEVDRTIRETNLPMSGRTSATVGSITKNP